MYTMHRTHKGWLVNSRGQKADIKQRTEDEPQFISMRGQRTLNRGQTTTSMYSITEDSIYLLGDTGQGTVIQRAEDSEQSMEDRKPRIVRR